jgi:hypothetical protein
MATRASRAAETHDDAGLAREIRESRGSTDVLTTTLRTDERVIARVTDGIYRQPGSALRELISNAYDADATRVVIKSDAPRFERISIEDDGNGMSPEMLAHLLLHIGGSPKRTSAGQHLGMASKSDPARSPGGRRLIGKIGIGLFSVSQLTHTFQLITKVKGERFRTVATVALKQYSDDEPPAAAPQGGEYETGKVNIWREKAADVGMHGTTIVLTRIRPQARDTLRSRDIWASIEQNELLPDAEDRQEIEPPRFHIGRVDSSGSLLKKTGNSLASIPWEKGDDPAKAFRRLVHCVWDEAGESDPNPRLERIFDYYLRMVWQLSLAIPVPYVQGHLFDMPAKGWADVFQLSNLSKGAASGVHAKKRATIRRTLGLHDPHNAAGAFDVYFDDLQLLRPIRFRELPSGSHAIKTPLVFVGAYREEFRKVPRELSGGPLAFEAYLFWTPKVVPTEHQGSLVRIHGSSGTLFDPTFMRYQVSEQTRLRQIVCEIFVSEGLESALNIDRESFNSAHPHSVILTKWLHSALRQLATAQKRIASETRQEARSERRGAAVTELRRVASQVWKQEMGDPASAPPAIELAGKGGKPKSPGRDTYVFERAAIVPAARRPGTAKARAKKNILEEKLKAIAQVLASFGLLDSVPRRKQEKLLQAIYKILETPDA